MFDNNIDKINEFAVFCLSQDKSPAEVTLRSTDWAVITQIDGHKTVKEIAKILAFSMEEAIARFAWLYDKGLLRFISTDKGHEKLLPADFFKTLESELIKIIGPVAPFVIDDVLWTLDEKKEEFKLGKIAGLIESLTEEIPDEQKKLIFQQNMLELLKGLDSQ